MTRPDPKPSPKAKKPRKPLKRTAIKKKHKNRGEAEVFRRIWDSRPHVCTNCGVHLGNEANAFFFAHIIRKSKREDLRLEESNIRLLCFQCHFELDHGTKESFAKRTVK